jgi:hypothetical protein
LEKVIRDVAVNIRGTIFYKFVQILAYADDIDIIGRTQSAMIEVFTSLEKTKYMPVTMKSHSNYPHHLEVG